MEGHRTNKPQPKGKQRIAMKIIDDEEDRLITFSKRRAGIFKKASELVTLCGVEIGLVVFSPSGKPFSFGQPSVDLVADRFMADRDLKAIDPTTNPILEALRRQKVENLNEHHNKLADRLEDEKALQKALTKKMNGLAFSPGRRQRNVKEDDEDEDEEEELEAVVEVEEKLCWDAPLDGLGVEALKERYRSLQELHKNICSHVKERKANANASFGGNLVAHMPPP